MRKSLFKTRVQALYGHRPPLTTSPPPITAKQNSPLVIARTRNCFVLTRPLWWCRALGNVLAMVRTPVMSRWTSRRIILPRHRRHRSNYPRPLYLPLNWALEPLCTRASKCLLPWTGHRCCCEQGSRGQDFVVSSFSFRLLFWPP